MSMMTLYCVIGWERVNALFLFVCCRQLLCRWQPLSLLYKVRCNWLLEPHSEFILLPIEICRQSAYREESAVCREARAPASRPIQYNTLYVHVCTSQVTSLCVVMRMRMRSSCRVSKLAAFVLLVIPRRGLNLGNCLLIIEVDWTQSFENTSGED